MIKKEVMIAATVIALCAIPGPALAKPKISLQLWGGWAYLAAGDVNAGTQAFFDWGRTYFAPPPGGTITGGYEAVHWGHEFGGDIIFQLSPKIGIGIGIGYLESSKDPAEAQSLMEIIDDPSAGANSFLKDVWSNTNLRAIPLKLSVFLTLPLGGKFHFSANAGLSYFLQARYEATWGVSAGYLRQLTGAWGYQTMSTTAEQKKLPVGFQAGLGVEYNLFSRLAFFIETQGRYARFSGLEGSSLWEEAPPDLANGLFPPFSYAGKLYFENVPAIPGEPRLIVVQDAPPAGPSGQPREAVVDFSGISLLIGVRIHF
jgi:hypothetical protein